MAFNFKIHSTAPAYQRYLFMFVVSGTAFLLTYNLKPLMGSHTLDFFQSAVFLSAWIGGFGPGILSTALCMLGMTYYLMPPIYSFSVMEHDFIRLATFGVVGLLMSSLSSRLRQANLKLQSVNNDLEMRLNERTQEVLQISNREQLRVGQDLHDGLCQTLAGVRLLIEALERKPMDAAMALEIKKIEARLQEAQSQASSVSYGLYPVELETDGLREALTELAERITILYSIPCKFICEKKFLVDDHAFAVHLYRIIQEAVMNAVKHGKARKITIQVFNRSPEFLLLVADDGGGFDASQKTKGMGLKIMNYRAKMIGATLRIQARKRRGTLVSCRFKIPLTAGENYGKE